MKKSMLIILLVVTFTLIADEKYYTDEIFLKNGNYYWGEIIGKKGEFVYIKNPDTCYKIQKGGIKKIVKNGKDVSDGYFDRIDFMSEIPEKFEIVVSDFGHDYNPSETRNTYPNMHLLPLSFLCFAIAWDSFADANNISDVIDAVPAGVDSSDLKSDKIRKNFVGGAALVAGIFNTMYCFERIEVKASPNSLTLNYKF